MIIDAHVHIWQRSRTPQPWLNSPSVAPINSDYWIDDLAAHEETIGGSGAIVVQCSNTLRETFDLLATGSGTGILGVVGWVDLEGDVISTVRSLQSAATGPALVGIRHLAHDEPRNDWLVRDSVSQGLRDLAMLGLPFDLVVHADQLAHATRVVSRHPEVTFVLDHLGKPPLQGSSLTGWRRDLEAMAALPNVVAKLSGLTLEANWSRWTTAQLAPAVHAALNDFGPDRLMFGSDWPLVDLAGGAPKWLGAARDLIPTTYHEQIFDTTARATYSLGVANADT